MPRLIDANEILKSEHQHYDYMADEYYVTVRDIENAPTVDAEPKEEQVKEYCRKRCLAVVDNELFNEMKARWSAEPVRHGHWIRKGYDIECSECHARIDERDLRWAIDTEAKYCLNCGCKMDEKDD